MTQVFPDPMDPSVYLIGSASEPIHGQQIGSTAIVNVHDSTKCAGYPCVMHRPSAHHMRDWPLNWRGDKRVMERTCPHGVGHPDPDDAAYQHRLGRAWMTVHGCDINPETGERCCARPNEVSSVPLPE